MKLKKRQPHEHKVRVYYCDTDAGGIVYHGQYLSYFDQGRTEYLRTQAIDMSHLQEEDNFIFVVARMDLKYAKAARMDDQLVIKTELNNVRSRSLEFKQQVILEDAVINRERLGEVLVEASVDVIAVNTLTNKACRLPAVLLEKFSN